MHSHDITPAPLTPELDTPTSAFGRRRFIAGVGAATAGVFASGWTSGVVSAAVPTGASQFVALPQVTRVLDTRDPAKYEFQTLSNHRVRVTIAGKHGVPADASAVVATLTAVNGPSANWVTMVPLGTSISQLLADNKLVSILNLTAGGQASANLAQVRMASGGVDIASRADCDVVLDVIGYYVPVAAAVREGRFIALATAKRAIDTRSTTGAVPSNSSIEVDVTAFTPASTSSVLINLTATETTGAGFFTAYPVTATKVPTASSLNVNAANETRAAAVIVPVETEPDNTRKLKVYAKRSAQIIVDVTGVFTGPTSAASEAGLFVPVDPVRILDTREPGTIGKLWQKWTVEGKIPGDGATAAAAVVNLTGVDSRGPGFLTISAARRARPGTSTLNFSGAGQVVPNHAVTPITATSGYQVYASGGAHVVVDYMGYYTGTPQTPTTTKPPVNPPPPPIGPEWTLAVPSINLVSRVLEGNGTIITNQGHSWHWEGTGFMGEDAHVAAFAHRTTHGGAYRNLHLIPMGSTFTVTTLDRREYTYQVMRRDLTNSVVDNILAATKFQSGTTFSMIACTRTDFLPTNTAFRIVVTGKLVSWREI